MKTLLQLGSTALLAVLGTFLALLAAEAGFRIASGFAAPKRPWSDRPAFYFQDDAAKTLQDYAFTVDKPPQVFRIAVVGDSYSFAPYMQFTDAFPKQLERMLNLNKIEPASPGYHRAQVINFGVPGYSTSHEIADVKSALEAKADLVLLQITLNDAELKPYRPIGIREFGRFGPYTPGPLAAKIIRYSYTARFVLERLHNERTKSEYTEYFLDLFNNPRTWGSFAGSVRKIARICDRNNVKLVAVVFPLFGLPLDRHYPFHPIHQKVAALLHEHKIDHLNLFSAFEGAPLERIQVIPGEDRHPNEIAHRIAAEQIYLWLEQTNQIPNELQIRKRYVKRTQIRDEEPIQAPIVFMQKN